MSAERQASPPIWVVSVCLGAASIAIALTALRTVGQLSDALTMPIPLLIVAFVLAEYFVVHLHFHSESGTFSFIVVPLVLGAMYAPAVAVWASMTLGAALAFMLLRRQSPMKAAFNTANLSLEAAVALWIMHSFVDRDDPLGPFSWLVVTAAAIGSSGLTVVAFLVVVTMMERKFDPSGIKGTSLMSVLSSSTNAMLALIAATLVDARPVAVVLMIGPLAVLFIAYRAFASEREQRERVQRMYESAREISAMRHQSALPAMLAGTATRLRAARADLMLLPDREAGQAATWFSADEGLTETRPMAPVALALVPRIVKSVGTSRLVADDELDMVGQLLDGPLTSALVGVVRGDDDVLGLLIVGNRLGDVAKFAAGDLALFSTVVDQLGLALENDQLGQTVSELKRVERELSEQAHHDALTGLANRTLLSSVLTDALTAGRVVSVLYIDLDDFKTINDGLGHEAGDLVLIETGRRLTAAVGPEHCVARLGGDEFVVVLFEPGNDVLTANDLLETINQPIVFDGYEAQVGASIGLTRARPGQDPAALISNADAAMYTAKGSGKGSVALDSPATRTRIRSTTPA